MPIFDAQVLRKIGCELFEAAGCRGKDARTVVDHLVESNLFGHDSHGPIRFHEYAKGLRTGLYQAATVPQVVKKTSCTAVVDGQGALGQIGATYATRLAMKKSHQHGMSAVTLRHTSHIGRVGAYPLMASREGLIGLIFVNAGRHGVWVAPFGGIDGKLSTNPIAFAAPRRNADPIMLDMTTSVVAVGKINVAANREQKVPEGWLIDAQGRPSRNPKDLLDKPYGALLPLGGVAAHKGYGLGILVEILGGALSGQDCAAGEREVVSNGALIVVYRIDLFTNIDDYYEEVESLINHIRSSRLAEGSDKILIPGEVEFISAQKKKKTGIDIDETTWNQICHEARHVGLNPEKWDITTN